MLNLTIKSTGVKDAQKEIDKIAKKYPKLIRGALYRKAERIMTRSKNDYCPVESGNMAASGRVERMGEKLSVMLVYGGTTGSGGKNWKDCNYAISQHENPDYKHEKGEWKFLETPLNEAAPTLAADLAKDCEMKSNPDSWRDDSEKAGESGK
jgi:hypothetical protein